MHLFPLLTNLLVTLALAATECSNTNRNTFLWSVNHPDMGHRGFLFGTIHVPYTEVWDKVSDRVRDAFSASDTVLLEVDLNDDEVIRKLVKCRNLPKKQTARQYLDPKLYGRIESFMHNFRNNLLKWAKDDALGGRDSFEKAQEIYENVAGSWYRKRPEWLLFSLYQMCENLLDRPTAPMLDMFLANQAYNEGKDIQPIETAKEQCRPVTTLSLDDIVFTINYTMYYLEHIYSLPKPFSFKKERSIDSLVEHYKCGNIDQQLFDTNDLARKGFEMSIEDRTRAKLIDQELKQDIITRRNDKMTTRLNEVFSNGKNSKIFAAVGTGHFVGEDSIITKMQHLGYTVEPIKDSDKIPSLLTDRKVLRLNSLWTRAEEPIPEVTIELISISSKNCFLGVLAAFILLLLS